MKKILMKLMAITLALMFTLSMPGVSAIVEAVAETPETAPSVVTAKDTEMVEAGYAAKIGDDYYKTLQEAVTAAKEGAEVTLLTDVKENVVSKEQSYTLDLNGFTVTGAKAGYNAVVQIVGGTVTIKNGVITGGKPTGSGSSATGGRGLNSFRTDLTLIGVTVTKNQGAQRINASYKVEGEYLYGAGIFASGGTLTMIGCTVSDNESVSTPNNKDGGGIYALNCTVNMTRCNVVGNTANGGGAGLFLSKSDATVTDSTFAENASSSSGGAVSIYGGNFISKNTDYIKNSASGIGVKGVAVYYNSTSSNDKTVEITGGTFSENFSATKGTALISLSGNMTIRDATFTGNNTGSIISHSPATGVVTTSYLGNLTIKDNDNLSGSAISFSEKDTSITIENCRILNNKLASGEAITLATEGESSLNKIIGCTVSGNTFSSSAYGAIYLKQWSSSKPKIIGKTTIENCNIENNTGAKSSLYNNYHNTDIIGGAISGNTATTTGGFYLAKGTVTMSGTKITGNTAATAGGINHNNGDLTLNNVLIQGNVCTGTSTSTAGGILFSNASNGPSFSMTDTVIKENKGYIGGVKLNYYAKFTMNSGAIYNNTNNKGEASDLYVAYSAAYHKYIPAKEMTDGDFDFSEYTWELKGKKAEIPNVSSSTASTNVYTWNVVEDENSSVAEIVHSDGTTTPYSKFNDAFTDVKEGETIRLLKANVTASKVMKLTGKSFTLDLNGNGLYLNPEWDTSDAIFTIENNRTLTITGSGVVGQYIKLGQQGSSKAVGNLIIDATGNIKINSLRTGTGYTPVYCLNGQVTVKGGARIEELSVNLTYRGNFTLENGTTIGTLNITDSSSDDINTAINGDVDNLILSQSGKANSDLNGSVGNLVLKHFRSSYTTVPETHVGNDFKLTGSLEFYPMDYVITNTGNNAFDKVNMADPLEHTPDVLILRGDLSGKVNTENVVWYNTVGGLNKRELVWKTENGGNGLN